MASPLKYGHSESGNVILIIFVAVALLAALSFVLSRGSRTGEAQLSEQQAHLLATEILDYSNAIREAVRLLRIQGCQDTEISFENSTVTTYVNASSPADNTCHVFHPSGGGQLYLVPNNNFLDSSLSAFTGHYYGEWSFFGNHCIPDVGTCATNAQLMLNLSQIQDAVCNEINERAGINVATPPTANWSVSKGSSSEFTGTYFVNGQTELANTNLSGHPFGCFRDNVGATANHNIFYQVLLAR